MDACMLLTLLKRHTCHLHVNTHCCAFRALLTSGLQEPLCVFSSSWLFGFGHSNVWCASTQQSHCHTHTHTHTRLCIHQRAHTHTLVVLLFHFLSLGLYISLFTSLPVSFYICLSLFAVSDLRQNNIICNVGAKRSYLIALLRLVKQNTINNSTETGYQCMLISSISTLWEMIPSAPVGQSA